MYLHQTVNEDLFILQRISFRELYNYNLERAHIRWKTITSEPPSVGQSGVRPLNLERQ